MTIALLLLTYEPVSILAHSMQDSYNQAEAYRNDTKLGNPNSIGNKVIFNKDANVSNLTNMRDQDLTNQGGNILNNSLEGKFLQQMEMKKIDAIQEYDLNSKNPLITNATEVAADPLKHTEGSNFSSSEVVTKTKISKSCTEGVDFEIDIIKQLHLEVELIDKWGDPQNRSMAISESDLHASWLETKIKEHYYNKDNWWRAHYQRVREEDYNVGQQLRVMIATRQQILLENIGEVKVGYTDKSCWLLYHITVPTATVLNYTYRDKIKEFKEKGEYWQVINEESEKLAEENECHELNRLCLESGNKIFFNSYVINRPCWKEQITYQCSSNPRDGCNHLKVQGCQLENSTCLKRNGNICLLWQRNYSCFNENKSLSSSLNGASMFCLGGDCHTPTIEQNTDISNVGYLAMLNGMKKDMQLEPIEVFKGEANSCRKNIVNFLNCCSSMKGWGKDLGLGRCKATEKALALQRNKGQCHFIGTYCSERDPIFKQCITKKSTYCCFNSKLARVFQEQGKQQLGISFGSAKNANCRGFTVEELQRIDFSKFNMEELFADLLVEAKNKMGKNFPKQLHNQIPVMQKQLPINGKSHNSNLSY
ncbi:MULTISPECIES: conjugal transfer protein TraN [spotted fever group]|uniref:Conjugal transfer mating pair stabilization protein TraN n=2 Tax=Rickettsia tamurae TaxID=334545 RepID=A0A8E0WMI9_9RICK|nr:conjugal transfer protein TraN [Rickettsia endosymbiont of Ixodes scapularis]KDO02763.1 conjugal transfer mating pair stabilization protein TraN [Rickettsia tamurae subsp. buchneri]KDO03392.1 conjugal transfer mating pair stabilization protein TraN [Rickettsia tamurae subsp. buchneri]